MAIKTGGNMRLPQRKHFSLRNACTFVIAFTSAFSPALAVDQSGRSPAPAIQQHIRAASGPVLEDFQVYPPVLTVNPAGVLEVTDGSSNASVVIVPNSAPTCQQTLVEYNFAYSYGHPYVGQYSPPSCSFNRVTWNLTVTSQGRQYDRLATVSFGDIELFRTSTAEPTYNGIEWTYLKDMTNFLSLFKESQTLIFDLGNLLTDTLTGTYHVTLTAAFFTSEDSITPADLIVPISKRQGSAGQPSAFTLPGDNASNVLTLPQNIKRAVFTVAATGQSEEEFWWSNVPQSQINTFDSTSGQLYGYSPFREVQLLIDGQLAGVAWPYPVIFTGGVVPGLWRPIVGIDAFDLKEDEIDITPWLPLLCDGKAHNFTIVISGLNDDGQGGATLSGTTDSYWLADGKVFIWYDREGHVTTGMGPEQTAPEPEFHVTSSVYATNGTNETLVYSVSAHRNLYFSSVINLSTGPEVAFWSQTLSFSNVGNDTDEAFVGINTQNTKGQDVSSSGYARQYSYPLYAYSVETLTADGFTLYANVARTKDVKVLGQPVFPTGLESFSNVNDLQSPLQIFQGSSLHTSQNGTATYGANETAGTAYSFGMTTQELSFSGINTEIGLGPNSFPSVSGTRELFHRDVTAVNSSVIYDHETLVGQTIPRPQGSASQALHTDFVLSGVPGRGNRVHSN